ncbi:MAG: alpha/beta hydrolase [Gammaproteobacteria bacterium]|nr:alpha/beta hydrolase [Gammaproteobacteria bacterium]
MDTMQFFSLESDDGNSVPCFCSEVLNPKGVVQIIHGMGEHTGRYLWAAQKFNSAGYSVFANDLRGHGRAIKNEPGDMGDDGWNRSLADLYKLNRFIKETTSNTKICLLGHSMGASLASHYVCLYGDTVHALILSGPPGFSGGLRFSLTRMIIFLEILRVGRNQKSKVLQKMLFGQSNRKFETEGSTGFEWLSRDKERVADYVEDVKCGFVLTTNSMREMFSGMKESQEKYLLERIPNELPVHVLAGEEDPIHRKRAGIDHMIERYRSAGVNEIKLSFYLGARHEMLNEINRDEVIGNLIEWLDHQVSGSIE